MIDWKNKSLFRRLLLSYLMIVLIGLGFVGFTISWFAKGHIYKATQEELLRKAKQVNMAIQHTSKLGESQTELLAFLDQSFNTRIWVFDLSGRIMATSTKDEVFIGKSVANSIVSRISKGQDVQTELQFDGLKNPMLSVVVPWGKKDEIYGGIVLHAPVEGLTETFRYIRETIVWATLFGVLLTTTLVSYLSWSISRPLRNIERTASAIEKGNYKQRVHIEHPAEIADLADTINSLAEKLEQVENNQKKEEKIRNDFLTNISHELRTPLTAMQGFLEALLDDLVEEEEMKKKYYDIMYQEAMHLNRLVDDLMDLIKLQNNDVTLFKTPVDINEVMSKVSSIFSKEAEEKGNELIVRVKNDLPRIHADKDRIMQILKNLVKNAVKFTENGEIVLSAQKDGEYLQVSVSDTGIGISEDDLDLVWERFFKGDRVRSKTNKGTGLGLAIVKELVNMHQGRITVTSQLGKGTSFTFWIPTVEKSVNDES
ncbi:ATP-binding protein [Ammoniphilus sp. YIM 78166]|uniref:sensor histidine kinase n=1 Tax=Ammoniphilus sp. YIM 78166 TaxID=1644106 RepID=UPI003514289E